MAGRCGGRPGDSAGRERGTTRFDPAVDVRNKAPGNRRFSFPAYVEGQDGPARIASLSVDVSYDDGATWQAAEVRRDKDRWTVTVRHPGKGYASLRSRTSDVDGNAWSRRSSGHTRSVEKPRARRHPRVGAAEP